MWPGWPGLPEEVLHRAQEILQSLTAADQRDLPARRPGAGAPAAERSAGGRPGGPRPAS